MSEQVSKRAVIKEILETGKNNGKISLNELNDRLSEIDVRVEDIEKIYEKLEKMGVEIVHDSELDNPEDIDFKASYNEYAYRNLDAEMLEYLNTLWENVKIN